MPYFRIWIIGLMIAVFSLHAIAQKDACVLYFTFSENAGKTVKDESDNRNDGKIKGGVKWAKGKYGTALEFGGKVGDFVEVEGGRGCIVDRTGAKRALERLDVDEAGFDSLDRSVMRTLLDKFDGGPVGLETLAASINEDTDTINLLRYVFMLYGNFANFIFKLPF